MTIIVSKQGKNSQKIEKSEFASEVDLQQYLAENLESIPLEDVKEGIKLVILAREFPTNSGPIDALGIDGDGQLYIIETKLYKNPDKRKVIAQVLDYGASLWKYTEDFDEFIQKIDSFVNKNSKKSFDQLLKDSFGIEDEEIDDIHSTIKQDLSTGNLKFVILMDELHQQLKDLVQFVNQNSNFTIFPVELEYYKISDEFEIMIPKIFGAQVKKSTKSYERAGPRDEEYHFAKCDEIAKSLYLKLKEKLLEISDDIIVVPLKKYIKFKRRTNFIDVQFQKSNLVTYINLKKGNLNDPKHLSRDVAEIGHYGNGDYEFTIEIDDEIDYVVEMAKQSYKKN